MSWLGDRIRDFHKYRPLTFQDRSELTVKHIKNRIEHKNAYIRNKAKQLLQTKKNHEIDEEKQQENVEKGEANNSRIQSEGQKINYIQFYQKPLPRILDSSPPVALEFNKLTTSDEEIAFQIYMLIMKKKPIFAVEEVKRKIRSRRGNERAKKASDRHKIRKTFSNVESTNMRITRLMEQAFQCKSEDAEKPIQNITNGSADEMNIANHEQIVKEDFLNLMENNVKQEIEISESMKDLIYNKEISKDLSTVNSKTIILPNHIEGEKEVHKQPEADI